tara:strand:- start:299 stop:526 length:228 start_codon:yes stop_codon:yes gene_type:complete
MDNQTIEEELHTLQNGLEVEVAKLIRERLENSSIDFIGGNALDILIDTNVDIGSIISQSPLDNMMMYDPKYYGGK